MSKYPQYDLVQDMAGKWRVMVELPSGEMLNLKFQTMPTETDIDNDTDIIINNRLAEAQRIEDARQQRIAELQVELELLGG